MGSGTSIVMQALQHHFEKNLCGERRCIVATSGGPDSQALLDALGRLAPSCGVVAQAVGVNHGLRPEAAEELALAAHLAHSHGLPFVHEQVVVPHRGNVLAHARQKRYRALRRAAKAFEAQAILLAHNLDDQAETVLFHLARGAGLTGAAGMARCRGMLQRPLLGVARADILAHLQTFSVPFAEDPSNNNPARSRTQMRRQVLPALAGINHRTIEHIGAFARTARQDDAFLQRLATRLLQRCLRGPRMLCTQTLRAGPRALLCRVLRLWLKNLGAQPDRGALHRLEHAVLHPSSPIAQGALRGCTVLREGAWLCAVPKDALPARRAGSLPQIRHGQGRSAP